MWDSDSPDYGQEDDHGEATQAYSRAGYRKVRAGERLVNDGKDLTAVLRELEISEAAWNRWRGQYGGMKASEARRLRELEAERPAQAAGRQPGVGH